MISSNKKAKLDYIVLLDYFIVSLSLTTIKNWLYKNREEEKSTPKQKLYCIKCVCPAVPKQKLSAQKQQSLIC
jgi:hypothetical protein